MTDTQAVTLNALALYGLALLLAAAFAAQLLLHELPCPLCLLQRILFALLAIGPILNIRFGPRPSHYALSLLTAVLGYHYYTWALIGFIAAIVLLAAMLLFDRQFDHRAAPGTSPGKFAQGAVWLVVRLTALNVLSTLLECGFAACADNPTVYELLKQAS